MNDVSTPSASASGRKIKCFKSNFTKFLFFCSLIPIIFLSFFYDSKIIYDFFFILRLHNHKFAYVFYASDKTFICHALVNAAILLYEFNTTSDVVIMLTSVVMFRIICIKNYNGFEISEMLLYIFLIRNLHQAKF
jgi:hypothetical protein